MLQQAATGMQLDGFLTKPVSPSNLLQSLLVGMGLGAEEGAPGAGRGDGGEQEAEDESAKGEALAHTADSI